MKATQTIIALVAGLLIGFFVGKNTSPAPAEFSPRSEEKTEIAKASTDVEESEKTDTTKVEEEKEETTAEVSPLPTKPIEPVTSTTAPVLPPIMTGISDDKISRVLTAIAKNLQAKNLDYVSAKMQDCSGIFHQIKDSLKTRLPALADLSLYNYPTPTTARSSRQIADWYYKNNNLLLVEDAVASKNSIRPGAVMFFGKSGKKFKNITIDQLTDRNNNYTKNGAIQHIAVVTSVTTDQEGNVVDYTMMHARYPGKTASMSGSKEVQSTRTVGLPPFGNWQQQWVAVANTVSLK